MGKKKSDGGNLWVFEGGWWMRVIIGNVVTKELSALSFGAYVYVLRVLTVELFAVDPLVTQF